MSQTLDLLVALSPLFLAAMLIFSNRTSYRRDIADDRDMTRQRDETIVALHYCKETVEKLQQEAAGLRWLVSTYGIRSATRPPIVTDPPTPPDEQVARHITAALAQERVNLAFLQEQIAKYGDSDLTRHNMVDATTKRVKELEGILDAYALAPARKLV